MINFDYIDDFMKKQYIELSNTDYEEHKKLEVISVRNATILPAKKEGTALFGKGGVIDENGTYLEISAQRGYKMLDRISGKYECTKIEKKSGTAIYMNYFLKHWGHFIIDVVPRMWYLQENKELPIVFTVAKDSKNNKITGNYIEFLKLYGIDEKRIIVINKPTKFDELIIPEMSLYPGKYYTKEYVSIFDKVVEGVKLNSTLPKKIYFSRSQLGFAKRKEIGEKEIEKFFNENGYISISPEKLSLKQQIEYIKSADEIVAISGTLPHNMLFGQPKKKWIIINKTYCINRHQVLINQMRQTNVTYIDMHISLFPVLYGPGPFILTLNQNAERFANDRKYKIKINYKTLKIKNFFRRIWYLVIYCIKYKMRFASDDSINKKELYRFYKNR